MTRVLCVDDEPHLLRTLGANLRARDYEVDLAPTGERALELASTHRPDAVILDLGLPDLDGLEVCRSVRAWSEVPIIVLSAESSEHRKVLALDGMPRWGAAKDDAEAHALAGAQFQIGRAHV